ncbi:MAG: hypothetical protein U5N85_13720 [Arcicella sp.]|nr:hypothetical protein [Arcicella sp.]
MFLKNPLFPLTTRAAFSEDSKERFSKFLKKRHIPKTKIFEPSGENCDYSPYFQQGYRILRQNYRDYENWPFTSNSGISNLFGIGTPRNPISTFLNHELIV